MKKFIFSLAALTLVLATSCKKDDDGDDVVCQTCTVDLLGTPIVSEVCDNMDGTVSITVDGETETQTLEEGQTYAQIIASFEVAGDCN